MGLRYVFSQLESGYDAFREVDIQFSISLVVLGTNF